MLHLETLWVNGICVGARGVSNLVFFGYCREIVSLDSSVGIATRYGLDGPVIESQWGANFSSPFLTGLGVYPTTYIKRTESFPGGGGVYQTGNGVGHPPHLALRVKKK